MSGGFCPGGVTIISTMLVPIILTILPGATPPPTAPMCASITPTAIGIFAQSPSSFAHPSESPAADQLYRIIPDSFKFEPIVPTSQKEPQQWRYTTDEPGEGWAELDFDDGSWSVGAAGFGDPEVVGAIVRTKWTGEEIL